MNGGEKKRMEEDKYPVGYEEILKREVAREALEGGGDEYEDINRLKEYINRLEAERDYYQGASAFAGVPNTPRPKELLD